ncbi:MAG: hypothetical protein ACYDDF_01705 [Thermoplasmatota archaeon]
MAARTVLTVIAVILLVGGALLIIWSVAPSVPGVDTPSVELDQTLTGMSGNQTPTQPFANLSSSPGTYTLVVTSQDNFVVGQRRVDHPDDALSDHGAIGSTAGGSSAYSLNLEFSSAISATNPRDPTQGPMLFFIWFPMRATPGTFHATATYTPAAFAAVINAKPWASLTGLTVGAVGIIVFVVRSAMRPKPKTDVSEAPKP